MVDESFWNARLPANAFALLDQQSQGATELTIDMGLIQSPGRNGIANLCFCLNRWATDGRSVSFVNLSAQLQAYLELVQITCTQQSPTADPQGAESIIQHIER